MFAYLNPLRHLPTIYLQHEPQRSHLFINFEIKPIYVVIGPRSKHYLVITILLDLVLLPLHYHWRSPTKNMRSSSRSIDNPRSTAWVKDTTLSLNVYALEGLQFTLFRHR